MADGAAVIILTKKSIALQNNWPILGYPVSWADAEVSGRQFVLSPAPSIQKALDLIDLPLRNIDYFEINEAFANAGV